MKAKLFFFVCFLCYLTSYSATIVSTVSGNWSDPTIWSLARVPTCGDSVVIPIGKTVTVDVQVDLSSGACSSPCYSVALNILGTLHFNTGDKLTLCDNSLVYFGLAAHFCKRFYPIIITIKAFY
jgi:hypothetical protein